MKGPAPQRFKLTLHGDHDFNYEIIADIMHLAHRPVLHVVDSATSFQAGRFLVGVSAKETWEALRACWIDTHLGPPDVLSYEAGTNFASIELKAEARLMGITCHQVSVDAHWSIGKVERYHAPLRCALDIILVEVQLYYSQEAILQMALKAVNDSAGPDGLVLTLLVFGAFPRINTESPPALLAVKRALAISKAMTKVRRIQSQKRVQLALAQRNGPNNLLTLSGTLRFGSEVQAYSKNKGWTGPFKALVSHNGAVVRMIRS